jgi:enoyl-CoA hydratase/carnithine racemase
MLFPIVFALATLSVNALTYPSFSTLTTSQSNGVLSVTIDTHTSSNVFNTALAADLTNLTSLLHTDTTTKVVVFSSGNPDYFIGLLDLNSPDSMSILTSVISVPVKICC